MFRFLSVLLKLTPLPPAGREALKSSIYRRFGFLFGRSHNYGEWLRLHAGEPDARPLARPGVPDDARWQALLARRSAATGGAADDPCVIVPVYRGRAETLACLASVLESAPGVRLVVVDDGSDDRVLAAELASLAEQGAFELIRNPRNLGFARSINIGIEAAPGRDVVLLNSDTEVHRDWLARLRRAAYSAPDIASVTPLSSNADLASYPRWLEDNPHQLELDDRALDALASEVNAGRFVETPTGVGFCLYVRRDCLDRIGPMDERFAAGYGEENDWCLRAGEMGFRHLIATNVFVRHYGAVSFGTSAAPKRRKALALLLDRHPDYEERVAAYFARDPILEARLALDLGRMRRCAPHPAPARSVLLVHHGWGGGVQTHVDLFSERLIEEGVNVFWLRPSVHSARDTHAATLTIGSPPLSGLPNCEALDVSVRHDEIVACLRILDIAHVHVHHLGGFGDYGVEWLQRLVGDLDCRYDVTLHDYTPFCPRVHLIDEDGRYCGEPDLAGCERCVSVLGTTFGPQSVWRWRNRWRTMLGGARRVFGPTSDVIERMQRHFPDAPYALRPHPEPFYAEQRPPSPRRTGEPLRVAVPGAIGSQKGFATLLACARDARARSLPIEFCIVGYSEDDSVACACGIRVTGRHDANDADHVLAEAGCHVALFLSQAPETWCFTLSSAFRVRLPPVVLDLGALALRVREAGFGHVLPFALADDPAALNDQLLGLETTGQQARGSGSSGAGQYPSLLKDYYDDLTL